MENPALYKLMFAPPGSASLSDNPFTEDLGVKSFGFLRQSVLACQAEGYLTSFDPDHVAFTLWSAVHGAASLMLQNRAPLTVPRDELIAITVDTIMSCIASTKRSRLEIDVQSK